MNECRKNIRFASVSCFHFLNIIYGIHNVIYYIIKCEIKVLRNYL